MAIKIQDTFFISHGSPTLSIDETMPARHFLKSFQQKVYSHRPSSILVISGHWETTYPTVNVVSDGPNDTIYDFYNFPKSMYQSHKRMASSSRNVLQSQAQLPKLNGRNYFHWSIQMKVLFESQDLWRIIEEGIEEPENPTALDAQQTNALNETKRKDKKALFLIYQAVDESIFERISSSNTAKEAWEMLFKSYRGEEKVKTVRLQTLRCEFDSLKMKETETIEEYYTKVIVLINQMRLNGESISDRRVVEKILRSLTRKFEYVVVAIEESKDLSNFSLETLLGTLQSHELRMRQFDTSGMEHVFQTRTSWESSKNDKQKGLDTNKEEQGSRSGTFKGKDRDADPLSYEEACQDKKWRDAMDSEINSILKADTWDLVELPKGLKSIPVRWIFKTKFNEKGEVDKYKARLVVKGYKQQFGINYQEVFAPVIRIETIRLILAIAAQFNWLVHQMDVKSAFLNGFLEEDVFIDQPMGYKMKGEEHKVCHLKKALYGLKQAPRAWYSRIEEYFLGHGFSKCNYEHTLFIKKSDNTILLVCIYVDDLIFTGNSSEMIEDFKNSMKQNFEMSDLGPLHYFLGIEACQGTHCISISQKKYAKDLLKRFNMEDSITADTPMEFGLKLSKGEGGRDVDSTLYRSLVGCLMYLTATRPDIMFSVSLVSRFMERPKKMHLDAALRILRYVKGSLNQGITYTFSQDFKLTGFSDSDYGGNIVDSKCTTGFVFNLGSGAISWQSKKQKVVALSSTEAEYMALSSTGCQALWLRGILRELGFPQETCTQIYCDNKSAITLTRNPVYHGRSKHIRIRFHFIRELVQFNEVDVLFCRSQDQVADIFTKSLQRGNFTRLKGLLGVFEV